MKLILASTSPRRKELLEIITSNFLVVPSNVDETINTDCSPTQIVMSLALEKAKQVALEYPHDCIIGADTIVVLDNNIICKPKDEQDAKEILRSLSGNTHQVFTGVAIYSMDCQDVFYEETQVTFRELSDLEIDYYIQTKEPMDKAGAYGIQGKGALFVSKITGDYYNVMGLPICKLNIKLFNYSNK
ncbi:MAG: Maf family protein [Oscillospiraceae bacterium]